MHEMVFSTSKTISNIFFLITNTVLAIRINWWISILVFICIIPKYAFKKKIEKVNYEFEKSQVRKSRFAGYLYSLLFDKPAAKEIRLFNIGDVILKKFIYTQHKLTIDKNKFSNRVSTRNILVNIPSDLMQILIKLYIIYKILIKQNTVGDFGFFVSIYENMNLYITSIIDSMSTYIGYNGRINDFKYYFMLCEGTVQNGNVFWRI
jgi:ABC-type multidrug transport system fused ATPase/permease subunit